jgi:hypothetical protein
MCDKRVEVELTESLVTCSFSILFMVASYVGSILLAVFYWWKTGTFPLRERIHSQLEELRNQHEEHHPALTSHHPERTPDNSAPAFLD